MTVDLSDVNTSGELLATKTGIGMSLAGILFILNGIFAAGKRKKRHSHSSGEEPLDKEAIMKLMMYKVLNEIDDHDCTGLALCDAIAIPQEDRSEVQSSIISTLSPHPDMPLAWADRGNPSAKYQYAAFIGQWASMTSNRAHCSLVFNKCPFPSSEVLKLLSSNDILPCRNTFQNLNRVRN